MSGPTQDERAMLERLSNEIRETVQSLIAMANGKHIEIKDHKALTKALNTKVKTFAMISTTVAERIAEADKS